ncbi:MAG TPA: LEA type 2 family protein [Steroidobacter sp.]|jgi:LEA14-like dessication related protein|nr:LEA type 2 family protein [Steroidobacteraceae bacterium]HLS80522.1 LEA type 2 family protein [Steroidobacter sp.]
MRHFIARGAIMSALLITAGCASIAPKIETPRLTIVRVAMTSADIFSQQFLVRLHVQNPNDRDLPVRGVDYRLFLEGDSFAEGVSQRPFVVPALGETEFDMTVRTNFVSGIGRLLSRLGGRSDVQYVFEGKVLTDLGMIRSVPFRESGSVNLKRIADSG